MKKYIMFVAGAILAGCAMRSPSPSFYTFAIPDSDMRAVSDKSMTVDINRVKVPEYLTRPQIVTISGVTADISQSARWAEDVSAMMHGRLIAAVGKYLPRATVKDANFMAATGDCGVFVEVYRMDGELNDRVYLDAVYSVACGDVNEGAVRRVHYDMPAGADYASYAAAAGGLMDNLARDIARDLVKQH